MTAVVGWSKRDGKNDAGQKQSDEIVIFEENWKLEVIIKAKTSQRMNRKKIYATKSIQKKKCCLLVGSEVFVAFGSEHRAVFSRLLDCFLFKFLVYQSIVVASNVREARWSVADFNDMISSVAQFGYRNDGTTRASFRVPVEQLQPKVIRFN